MLRKLDIDLVDCDLKFSKGGAGTFEGYLSVFGKVDSYGDTIFQGAYTDTIAGYSKANPMPLLLNHDSYSIPPIGIFKSLDEDDHGLHFTAELTKGMQAADDAYLSLKHKSMTGMSIGYKAIKAEENDHGGEDLHEIKLREGSLVTFPADDHARIDGVKFDEVFDNLSSFKEVELSLREVGCSRNLAKHLVSQFKELCQRDVVHLQTKVQGLEAVVARYANAKAEAARLERIQSLINGDPQ